MPNNTTYTLKAKVKAIRENWSMKYSATFVLCLLRDSGLRPDDTVGASVAVVTAAMPTQPPTNLLVVRSTDPKPGIEGTLHVCVKPLHYSYSSHDWFIEWFELNRLLGVSHFYLYNDSLSASVSCLLRDYRRDGLVTLLPWTTRPFNNQVDIRTENQFAAFNDCLYRSMPAAGWLLLIDIDELALPRRERTLGALLAAVRASYRAPAKPPSALLFRNAFFYRMWEDDKDAPYPLHTSLKTRRRAQPQGLKNRSKYAVRPQDAVELGNHFIWEMMPGAIATGIPTERALLHHYRKACEFGGSSCLTNPSTVDRTAHRWADELHTRVTAMTKRHAFKCSHTDRTYNQSSYKTRLDHNRP
ncbi:hypothetical protein JYU34_012855 [Plutella xylostella]|uniref:Glycosyltransferase family 92 protein n=1 Tax=Plutella xylostella TaxID=51655 RepID=A0ABQ7QCB4_PLUXY|nr:hypothetical protein JYU34_012855 [Plutella xylostella]